MLGRRSQAAFQYVITYAWLILIVILALGALVLLGVLYPGTFISDACTLPAGFSCSGTTLSTAGLLNFNLVQTAALRLNITAVGCTTTVSPSNMVQESPQIAMLTGNNYTFSALQCYSGSSTYSGSIGDVYTGYLTLNYTTGSTGLTHTVTGSLSLKVRR